MGVGKSSIGQDTPERQLEDAHRALRRAGQDNISDLLTVNMMKEYPPLLPPQTDPIVQQGKFMKPK